MFLKMARILLLLLTPALLITSCGEYSKALKSTDLNYKFEMAEKYYQEGEYFKALPLLEELIALYRGTDKGEKVYYYYAYCHYYTNDFYLASFYFKNFTKTYPGSKFSEECLFMSAYCYYKNSPVYSLDQTDTYNAIKQMQLFMNRYPTSERRDTCNVLIGELRGKLEMKSFEIAKQYYKTERYKAAKVAFENTLREFPGTKYREEITFLQLKSSYLLATNSISSKKEERLRETIKSYHKFVDAFGKSSRLREAENIFADTTKALERLVAQKTDQL